MMPISQMKVRLGEVAKAPTASGWSPCCHHCLSEVQGSNYYFGWWDNFTEEERRFTELDTCSGLVFDAKFTVLTHVPITLGCGGQCALILASQSVVCGAVQPVMNAGSWAPERPAQSGSPGDSCAQGWEALVWVYIPLSSSAGFLRGTSSAGLLLPSRGGFSQSGSPGEGSVHRHRRRPIHQGFESPDGSETTHCQGLRKTTKGMWLRVQVWGDVASKCMWKLRAWRGLRQRRSQRPGAEGEARQKLIRMAC